MNYPPRLRLAHLPTPIHKLERLSAEIGRDLYIWRDDLTGFVESGNKIRLQPANQTMEPRIVDADRCRVQGVVIGVLRSYHA